MSSERVLTERHSAVLVVTLHRPEARNAIYREVPGLSAERYRQLVDGGVIGTQQRV